MKRTVSGEGPKLNVEERIGKTAGRRRIRDAFAYGMELQASAGRLLGAGHGFPIPKGVFKFRTFEEADEWMIRMLAARPTSNRVPRNPAT